MAASQLHDISSTEGGAVVEPGEGVFPCDRGNSLNASALAEPCYHFTYWTGTAVDLGRVVDPNDPDTTVLVDGDYTLRANFGRDLVILSISSTDGGSVVPNQYCHFTYWSGTAVDANMVVDRFNPDTTVLMYGDYTLKANFECEQCGLTVSATEGGSPYVTVVQDDGSVTWAGAWKLQFDRGTTVTLAVSADSGYKVTNWSGTAWSTTSYLVIVLDMDHDLTANFQPAAP